MAEEPESTATRYGRVLDGLDAARKEAQRAKRAATERRFEDEQVHADRAEAYAQEAHGFLASLTRDLYHARIGAKSSRRDEVRPGVVEA